LNFPSIISLLVLPLAAIEPGIPNVSDRSTSNWVVSADFLAWQASEEIASIWTGVFTLEDNKNTWSLPSFDFNWNYGFRVGAGYDMLHDEWDTIVYWSWFRTDGEHAIPPSSAIYLIQPEFDAALLSGITLDSFSSPSSMSARWSLLYNMFDWELGRSYWVSQHLSLRPFIGVKGGWIHQAIDAKYNDLTFFEIFPSTDAGIERLTNHFWGVGPTGGINTQWRLAAFGSHFFDCFGDFSTATMWGRWSCSDVYKNPLPTTYSIITEDSSLGALMFRGCLGLGWDAHFRNNKSHFAAKLGFESQLWLNQLRIATFQVQRLHHDLTLQGVTFNVRFDF
jgi:hypothetical protein